MATRTYGTDQDAALQRDERVVWWILGILFLAAVVLLSLAYEPPADSTDAQELAATFVSDLDSQGLQSPDEDVAARTYGTEGGAICELTAADITEFVNTMNVNRAGGEVNGRSGFVDPRLVAYERTVVSTYCPERLEAFDGFVRDMRLRRTREALD